MVRAGGASVSRRTVTNRFRARGRRGSASPPSPRQAAGATLRSHLATRRPDVMPIRTLAAAVALLLAAPALSGRADTIDPGPSLSLDGLPPVPSALVEAVRPYTEIRGAAFRSWHPARREMLITTRFGDTDQIHLRRSAGWRPPPAHVPPRADRLGQLRPARRQLVRLFERHRRRRVLPALPLRPRRPAGSLSSPTAPSGTSVVPGRTAASCWRSRRSTPMPRAPSPRSG